MIYKLCSETQRKFNLQWVNQRNYVREGTNTVLHFQHKYAASALCLSWAQGDIQPPTKVESKLNSPGFRGQSCPCCPRRCVREPGALQLCLQLTPASDGLTLRGSSGAGPAVAADRHRVGVEGVDSRGTVGQLDRHLFGLVVGTDSMMGFDVGGFQNGLLSPQIENRKPIRTYHPVSFSWYHLSL